MDGSAPNKSGSDRKSSPGGGRSWRIWSRDAALALLIFAVTIVATTAIELDDVIATISDKFDDLSLGLPGLPWVSLRDLAFGAFVGCLVAATFLVVVARKRLIAEVSRRRVAEAESVASAQRFRDFAGIASHWLWERDAEGRLTYEGGQGTSHVIETADGRLTTAGIEIVGAPAIADEQLLALEASISAREAFSDLPLTTAPGPDRRAYVLVSGRPVIDDQGVFRGYRGSTRNVTSEVVARRDRQRASHQMMKMSEALRLSEQRFRDFAEASSHYMWESDTQRNITYISDGITHITGERPDEIIGRNRDDVITDEARAQPAGDALNDIVARREAFMDIPYARRTKFGTTVHLSISGKPYYSPTGEYMGYRGTTRDISLQINAQRDADEARRARDFAEASSRAKSEFLANMSHELRTPLNAIMGFSEVIARQLMGPVGFPAYVAYAHDIHTSARRLSRIIADLLDMSRIETGRYAIEPQEIVLAELLREIVAEHSERAQAKELEIDIAAIDPALRVALDRSAATQVLNNLLSNAIKFTPAHGRVAVASVPAAGGAVELSVRDSGIGIGRERLEHVFEPFQLAHPDHARDQGGAGIGLWLSRSLMRLHGGDLRIASVEGEGTTATVVVPATRIVDPGRLRHVA